MPLDQQLAEDGNAHGLTGWTAGSPGDCTRAEPVPL